MTVETPFELFTNRFDNHSFIFHDGLLFHPCLCALFLKNIDWKLQVSHDTFMHETTLCEANFRHCGPGEELALVRDYICRNLGTTRRGKAPK